MASRPPASTPTQTAAPRAPKRSRIDARDVARERSTNTAIARFLDEQFAVPGTRFRFGFEPILGLIPVIGDYSGLGIGAVLVLRAAKQGASAPVLARMAVNLLGEATIGSVPIVGDVFDFFWKANTRNLRLLEADLVDPEAAKRRSTTGLVLIGVALIGVLALLVTLVLALVVLAVTAIT